VAAPLPAQSIIDDTQVLGAPQVSHLPIAILLVEMSPTSVFGEDSFAIIDVFCSHVVGFATIFCYNFLLQCFRRGLCFFYFLGHPIFATVDVSFALFMLL
jgi:hypothetical protein